MFAGAGDGVWPKSPAYIYLVKFLVSQIFRCKRWREAKEAGSLSPLHPKSGCGSHRHRRRRRGCRGFPPLALPRVSIPSEMGARPFSVEGWTGPG